MKNDINHEREEILPEIQHSEEELRHAVGELQTAVKQSVDPRAWIAARPVAWLIGCLLVGFWLGMRNSSSEG